MIAEEVSRLSTKNGDEDPSSMVTLAADLLESLVEAQEFPEFLTIPAYQKLLSLEGGAEPSVA